jgi:perosamine synthetase
LKKITQIEPSLGNEEKRELISVMDSGWYTEAAKTREFEKTFASFVGSKYAVVVTSGAAALYLGLKALGIKHGGDVVVPDLTFVASPNSVEMAGARSVLVDIEPQSLNLDISKLKSRLTKKTKAIMPVDFNGRSADIFELKEFTDKNDLVLIEDACHAIGSYYGNKHMGTVSDVGVFSFSTPKIITTGQGGMIVTNNKNIYEKCVALKDFGRQVGTKKDMRKAFEHKTIGYNFKFTEFQAAIGLAQMRKLKTRIRKKRQMLKKYNELLDGIKEIEFVKTDLNKITPWMMDILVQSKLKKDRLIAYLEKRQIGTRIFYPPIHRLIPYKESDSNYRFTSNISDRGLWLPSSVTLTDEDLEIVCKEIKQFFSSSRL